MAIFFFPWYVMATQPPQLALLFQIASETHVEPSIVAGRV
jgi:hypothetical protein